MTKRKIETIAVRAGRDFDTQIGSVMPPIHLTTTFIWGCILRVKFRRKKAKAMADQLTTVSKKRLINHAGSMSSTEMEGIGRAITVQLDL